MIRLTMIVVIVWFGGWFQPSAIWPHGVASNRFFPEPLIMEDPFAADELDLPAVTYRRGVDERELSFGVELQKRITPTVSLSVESEYLVINPLDPMESNSHGFSNPEFSIKWTPYVDGPHEAVIGLIFSVAPSIGHQTVSEAHAAIHPMIVTAKGFGDLPDALLWLRPAAVEAAVGVEIPIGATDPEASHLTYNLALHYSLLYLQDVVEGIEVPAPLYRLFPMIEFEFVTPLSGSEKGRTEAFAYPGLIWAGHHVELGIAAQIPLTDPSGQHIGVVAVTHFFLDNIAPSIFSPLLP